MRDLIILPSWLVVNPSPEPEVTEPEVTEPFWDPWFGDRNELTAKLDEILIDVLSDEERSDEVNRHACGCAADGSDPCMSGAECVTGWGSDEERSDEVCPCEARDPECDGNKCFGEKVTEPRGIDCQCAICLGGSN